MSDKKNTLTFAEKEILNALRTRNNIFETETDRELYFRLTLYDKDFVE